MHGQKNIKLCYKNIYTVLYSLFINPTAWPRIIMLRRLKDGNPCVKGQLEDLKHVGKTKFWKMRNMNVYNWKKMAQNRDRWKKAVEQARTLYRL